MIILSFVFVIKFHSWLEIGQNLNIHSNAISLAGSLSEGLDVFLINSKIGQNGSSLR